MHEPTPGMRTSIPGARRLRTGSRVRRLGSALALGAGCLALTAGATTIVLRISVVNPRDRPQQKEVRSHLPRGIELGDVLDTDGLELRYDIEQARYYVFQAVTLAPKERIDYRVEMRDVWAIPPGEIVAFKTQAQHLDAMLRDTAYGPLAGELARGIRSDLQAVQADQERYAIGAGARAADHIRVYFNNRTLLEDARNRIGQLENLVLSTGRDPGRLMGSLEHAPPAAQTEPPPAPEPREARIQITVSNREADRPRTIRLRRELPRELQPRDVRDADGLEVGFDPGRAVTYLSHETLELEPGETRTFTIRIRDPWNVHEPRIRMLRESTATLLERHRESADFPSVETFLEEILAELDRLRETPAPAEVNDHYVAFFRAQSEQLDEISRRIGRVEAVLKTAPPPHRLGFDVQPPDPKTTWLIIYAILGFMGLISLLFFLRWYGAGRGAGAPPTGPATPTPPPEPPQAAHPPPPENKMS